MAVSYVNFADMKNPETGASMREENFARQHTIPLGALVEIASLDTGADEYNGLRLRVVSHDRDCDGTPLYTLSFSLDLYQRAKDNAKGSSGVYCVAYLAGLALNGMSEELLTVIKEQA
ncbi:hypothetical protein [Achromobacter phage Motura]|uniref:Uncharacterized protein n=1 Tax=Achromobacter phage Motura TaxID=2591403 RepID=A0A514CSS3_9CAUD|nr:hypothetical protein H1O15_gp296 [Achromobacter phage Motura]QDH83510.1 hypothetical protein [Achromobacter phage Motura]